VSAGAAILLANNTGAAGAAPVRVDLIQTAGAGSVTVPAGATVFTAEAIGSGGNGFGSATTGQRAGGGGGQYAISNAKIATSVGNTIFYSVGAIGGGNDSWVNTTNAVPTVATTGCRARGGTNAAASTAGIGSTAGGVGATIRNGGNGTTGNNSPGGGGSGATTAASGQTGGTDTTGLSSPTMAGGNGGGTGAAGTAPGGGGGNNTVATNPVGSIGRVRIIFYAS